MSAVRQHSDHAAPQPTAADKDAARRFLDCCYDSTLRMPTQQQMARLELLGWVERLDNGAYAESPTLRAIELW